MISIKRPIHIHHGDCVEFMATLPSESIDLVVTDPPYGVAYKTGMRHDKDHRFTREIIGDRNLDAVKRAVPQISRLLRDDSACFMFCAWSRQDEVASILAGGVHCEEPHRLG